MKTRDFAAKYIRFDKASPVTGPFRLEMYPILGKPMDASDDIRIKRLVIYKASSCLGTVLGQIINTKRIAVDVGDQIMVCQTDDDATKFTKTRGKEWMESVPTVMRLLKNDKYAQTNDLWLFRHKFLKISGPGITAAQSDQVRYVQTDESHLDAYAPGRLVEWEKRMGARWDRQATHISTAANEGKEIDQFYYQGTQEEWHWRCTKCNELVLPLWSERAEAKYNGERVFIWKEYQSETQTLESIKATCPYCHAIYNDNSRERFSLQRDADYVAMNPTAPIEFASFQWAAFAAAHWMPWREFLSEHLAAIAAAKMGDLKPHEDFVKKRECRSYRPEIPDLGEGCGASDYVIGSIWITEHEKLRTVSFDVQDEDGFHLWAQCDEFLRNGDSRRLDYQKLPSWEAARSFQQHHGAKHTDTFCDAGHRMREVFKKCEEWGWYALFSTDDYDFVNMVTVDKTKPKIPVKHPYSIAQSEDAMIGQSGKRVLRWVDSRGRAIVPAGYCLSRRWSKPTIGGYLMALKGGQSRYYGIAKDMSPDYVSQLNSYTYAKVLDKKYGTTSVILRQVKKDDHAFATSSMCLLGAVIRGFFPLAIPSTTPKPELIEA